MPKCLFFVVISLTSIFAQSGVDYEPWDWVTFKNVQFTNSITEGNEYIYFGTNGGIMRYHLFGRYWDDPITESQGIAGENIIAVHFDFNTQVLWASTSKGLNYSLDGGARWHLASADLLRMRPGEKIHRIGSTSDYLWCITRSQVMKVDRLSGFLISPYATLPDKEITWGSAVNDGIIDWREVFDGYTATGGWIFHGNQLNGPNFEEVTISTVFQDRFGDIWVGTFDGPVFYADPQMLTLEPLYFGPAQTSATVLLHDESYLWMGGNSSNSNSSGITRFDYERGYWDLFRKGKEIMFGSDQILSSIVIDEEIWFGTTSDIQIFNKKKNSWYEVNESRSQLEGSVFSLAFDGDYVYAGSSYGIVKLNPSTRRKSSWEIGDAVRGSQIHELHFDGKSLWISWGVNNLWKWTSSSNELETFSDLPNSNDEYFNLVELHSRKIAISSYGDDVYFGDEYGILIYNHNRDSWTRLKGAGRLVGHQFTDLEVTASPESGLHYLWAAFLGGVYLVNLENFRLTHISKKDGLPSNKVYALTSSEDYIWFGTPSGLSLFDWKRYFE